MPTHSVMLQKPNAANSLFRAHFFPSGNFLPRNGHVGDGLLREATAGPIAEHTCLESCLVREMSVWMGLVKHGSVKIE